MAILKSQRKNRARAAAKISAKLREQTEQQQAEQQQQQQAEKQTSAAAPASPQMKPEATPMVEVEQQQQPEIISQPASDAASSSSSSSPAAQADAAAVPEPEAPLSAEDQKWATLLRTVSDRLGQIEFELPMLRAQIANHTARVCVAHLKQRLHKMAAADITKLQLAHKQIKYNVGMLDENSMQAIFKLDSIMSENSSIRAQRKATVKRGNAIIQESVQLREKLARWDRFMPEQPKQPEVPASKPKQEDVQMKAEAPAAAAAAPSTPAAEEASMMEDEDSVSEDEMEQKYAEPKQTKQQQQAARPATAQPRAAAPAPAVAAAPALTPLQKKYAHLQLPTYAGPTFHSRMHPHTGALIVDADLAGFQSDDVSVSSDPATRVLTIRGVKLPSRRRSQQPAFGGFFGFAPMPAAVEPHGFFTKSIAFEELDPSRKLNLSAMSATINNASGKLEISIPRNAVQQKATPPQPQRRAPVSHYSGFDDAEDEDEEQADAYSHPYASYYPQQRAAPRRAAYQPSPFFGNGWW